MTRHTGCWPLPKHNTWLGQYFLPIRTKSHISVYFCNENTVYYWDHFVWRLSVRPSMRLPGSHTFLVVMQSYVSQATHAFLGMLPPFLCRLRSIAAHRDHFVWRLSVCLSGSHTFLVGTQIYFSQVTHAFLGMLPLCCVIYYTPFSQYLCSICCTEMKNSTCLDMCILHIFCKQHISSI